MRISKVNITVIATALLLSFGAAPALAKKTGPVLKPGGQQLNVPQKKGSSAKFAHQGRKANPQRSACIRGVFKMAKSQRLSVKPTMSKAKGIVSHACVKLKNKVKPALSYAYNAGAFSKTGGTASKKTMKSCHISLKRQAKKSSLRPALKGKNFIRGLDKSCYQARLDGAAALKIAFNAGVFKSMSGKKKVSFGKKSKVRTFGKNKKGPKRYTPRQVNTCAKKVQYQIKRGKLTATSTVRKLNAMIRDNCIKLSLNAKRTFKNLRPHLKKTGPKLNAGKKRKNRKRSYGLNKRKNSKGAVRPIGKKNPTIKTAITECQQKVWKISSDSALNPKVSKNVIDRKILESCKLNANIAKRAFPKVRRYFVKSKKQVRPIGKSNSGKAAGAFGNLGKSKKASASEKCRRDVLNMAYIHKVKNTRKLTPSKMNALANGSCKQSKNNAKAAFKVFSNQM